MSDVESVQDASSRRSTRATERTRLINAEDDAVQISPLNLLVVRNLRRFTVFLLLISFAWWIVQVIMTFITLSPKLHSRGSGFTQLSFSTIAVFILAFDLLYFSTPSKADRILALAISAFLLADFIFIVAVSRLRTDEGWTGIATCLWAALMAAWVIVTDRTVQWGKEEEEERLLGYVQTRRTLGEWFKVLLSLISFSLLLLICVLTFLTIILRCNDGTLAAPGQRYWIDGNIYQVHLACVGSSRNGSATVILEGGENSVEYGLVPWVNEALAEGKIDRFCYWDRPGYGWSDNAPSPQSAGAVADALSEALIEAEIDGPYVIATHGVGGVYARVFASRHTSQTNGLLLIDTLHEDLLGEQLNANNAILLFLRGWISPLGVDRLFLWIFGGRTREDRTWGRSAWRGGRWTKARLSESLGAALTHNELLAARAILPRSVPMIVAAAGKHVQRSKVWAEKQLDLSRLSDHGKLETIDHVDHEDILTRRQSRDKLKSLLAQLI
ncbi:hypothetical protein PYCC9005_003022 [Savitreella phatthalungensis]